jgi:hypothetical protein
MSDQGFRHLQTDVTTTDDYPPLNPSGVQTPANLKTALKGVYPANLDGVRAWEIRTNRQGAGGNQQLIIGLPPDAIAQQITNPDSPRRRIKLLYFMVNSDVNSVPLPKLFRRTDNERFFPVDNPADIVRYSSGGKGGMRAALKDDNLKLGTTAFGLRSSTHAGCISADNNQSCLAHLPFSSKHDSGSCAPGK